MYRFFFKFAVGEFTSPRVIHSATWLTASWFVGELSCKLLNTLKVAGGSRDSYLLRPKGWGTYMEYVKNVSRSGANEQSRSCLPLKTNRRLEYYTKFNSWV